MFPVSLIFPSIQWPNRTSFGSRFGAAAVFWRGSTLPESLADLTIPVRGALPVGDYRSGGLAGERRVVSRLPSGFRRPRYLQGCPTTSWLAPHGIRARALAGAPLREAIRLNRVFASRLRRRSAGQDSSTAARQLVEPSGRKDLSVGLKRHGLDETFAFR